MSDAAINWGIGWYDVAGIFRQAPSRPGIYNRDRGLGECDVYIDTEEEVEMSTMRLWECPICNSLVKRLYIAVHPGDPKAPSCPVICLDCASKYPGVKFREISGGITV